MTDPTNPEPGDAHQAWELPGEPTGEALKKLIGEHFPFPPADAGPPDDAMLREAIDKAAFRAGRAFERSRQAEGASWKDRPDADGWWAQYVADAGMAVYSVPSNPDAFTRMLPFADGERWFGPISIPPAGEEGTR